MIVLDYQSEAYRRTHRRLQALCRYANRLPESCYLSGLVEVDSTILNQSALSDLYKGTYEGRAVAVKVIRTRMDNKDEIEKVLIIFVPCAYFSASSCCAGFQRRSYPLDAS